MNRAALRGCLLGLALLAPRVACTEGLWAEAGLRASHVSGTYTFEDEVNPGYGQTGTLELEAPVDAMAVELGGVLGYAGSRFFAVGAGPTLLVAGNNAEFPYSSFSSTAIGALSLEAAVRPLGDGLFLRPSVGFAWSRPLSAATDDVGSADNIFQVETLRGPILGFSAGWTSGLVSLSAKVSTARLQADRTKFHPLIIGLGVAVQRWSE